MFEIPRRSDKPIRVINDMGVMSVVGECPSCQIGTRSLIITDFIQNFYTSTKGIVCMKCIVCETAYETTVSSLSER